MPQVSQFSACVILADGVVDGDVALEGDADRHEDGGAHRDELSMDGVWFD